MLCARSVLAMDLDSEGDQSLSTFVRFDNADLGLPPGESDSEASPAQASSFRRSRRLAGEEPALPDRPTGDLSLSEILEALFRRGVPAPVNASRDELLGLLAGCDEPVAPASKGKEPLKRKRSASRPRVSAPPASGVVHAQSTASAAASRSTATADPVASALAAISSSLDNLSTLSSPSQQAVLD